MPFRLREDATRWFKELHDRKEFKILFDDYYFCFVAGIAAGRKQPKIPQDETTELIDYFPEAYSGSSLTLIALFLKSELDQLGLTMGDAAQKRRVHEEIAKLVDYSTPSKLSTRGLNEFNSYAHGGFEVLTEWFDDRPRTLETFLRLFKRKLDEQMASTQTIR
jgi:hypothetical protein